MYFTGARRVSFFSDKFDIMIEVSKGLLPLLMIRIAVIENGYVDRNTEDSIKQRLIVVLFKFHLNIIIP